MDAHPQHLLSDCLIHVFTFLPEEDLITASSVCKDWRDAAETPWLWRRMSLQRWAFCDLAAFRSQHVSHSWKKYFLRRSYLELKMRKGRSGGYTCRSLRGHGGKVTGLVYLQENSAQLPHLWNVSATVCSACTDGAVRVWNIQSGEMLWCSPGQQPLLGVVSDEQHEVVITAELTGLVKTWHGLTGQELGSFSISSLPKKLLQYNVNSSWFLTVGTSQGALVTLADSNLTERSRITVFEPWEVSTLLVSPDRRWIVAGTEDSGAGAKMICTESLTSPSEGEDPLCQSVPVVGCRAAVFVPTQPARLAIINNEHAHSRVLSVFDISVQKRKYKSEVQARQVASFNLNLTSEPLTLFLEASGSNRLVLAGDQELWVYSLKGDLLASFKDHTRPISSIYVDSFRVVTASDDLSLRVLTWRKDGDQGMTLESRYHLLGGSHSMSRRFALVACDFSSIVAVAEGRDGKDVLKVYSFTS